MSHPLDDRDPFEQMSRQETEEYLAWLSEDEKRKVEEIDKHMKAAFNEIFGGSK